MKRILIIIAAIAAALCSAQGQTLSWGAKAGVNIASMVGVEGLTPRVGVVAGGIVEYRLSQFASIRAEALFSMQGARYNDGRGTRAEYRYNYINAPLLAKFYPFDRRFALLAGVQFGYLDAPTVKMVCQTADGSMTTVERFKKGEYNPFEYSLAVGSEFVVWRNIAVEARYTLGMLQIHYGASTSSAGQKHITIPDNRNSVVQLGLCYRFGRSREGVGNKKTD